MTEDKDVESGPEEPPIPEGQLRWLLPNPEGVNPPHFNAMDTWHLSWGRWSRVGPITLCGHGLGNPQQKALGDFIPMKRCPACAATISQQLGL